MWGVGGQGGGGGGLWLWLSGLKGSDQMHEVTDWHDMDWKPWSRHSDQSAFSWPPHAWLAPGWDYYYFLPQSLRCQTGSFTCNHKGKKPCNRFSFSVPGRDVAAAHCTGSEVRGQGSNAEPCRPFFLYIYFNMTSDCFFIFKESLEECFVFYFSATLYS